MWYDTFLFQLQSFVDMFNGATFYWGNLINGTTITILLCAIFTIAATIVRQQSKGQWHLVQKFHPPNHNPLPHKL